MKCSKKQSKGKISSAKTKETDAVWILALNSGTANLITDGITDILGWKNQYIPVFQYYTKAKSRSST